jgi:periplasmic copper chaperone A
MIRYRTLIAGSAVAAALALPAPAGAHVTLSPDSVPADGFARFTVNVPNEQDNASTVKVSLKLPPGVTFVSFQPKPGWTRTVTMVKLDKPVVVEGTKITETVGTVTWSGGKIGPAEFDQFGVSMHVPNTPGTTLVMPATQTYSNGDVVRWIGPLDADEPAPHMGVTAAATGGHGSSTTTPSATAPAAHSSSSSTRTNVALGAGIVGLLLGLMALGVALRSSAQKRSFA